MKLALLDVNCYIVLIVVLTVESVIYRTILVIISDYSDNL